MKQHKSTTKDNQILSEMYGQIGGMTIQTTGNADEAAEQLAQDDGFNNPEEAAEDTSKKEVLNAIDSAMAQVEGLDKFPDLADALQNVLDHHKHSEDGEGHHENKPEDEAYM
tara:strand:- start:142 stop:477 length:336 start_codon:yes stop_codon:yes gene_type:complete